MSRKFRLLLLTAVVLAMSIIVVQAHYQFAPYSLLMSITGTAHSNAPILLTPSTQPTAILKSGLPVKQFPDGNIVIEEKLHPGVNYSRFIVSYPSDGLKIYALMTVPIGNMPAHGWPLIVFNHGHIIPSQYTTTGTYDAYVDAFARHGYIVFKSDYRGNGKSAGTPAGASTQSRSVYVTDVLNAVNLLKLNPYVDPNRIGMWGHSMGGYVTVTAMLTSTDIKAGVVWAGTLGNFKDSSLLKNLSGPLQLQHATGDQTVPYSTSINFANLMEKAGLNVELYTYQGDNHDLTQNAATALTRSLDFFDKYVKNAPQNNMG